MKRVLVANRREIAARIIKACRGCGIEAVADSFIQGQADHGILRCSIPA